MRKAHKVLVSFLVSLLLFTSFAQARGGGGGGGRGGSSGGSRSSSSSTGRTTPSVTVSKPSTPAVVKAAPTQRTVGQSSAPTRRESALSHWATCQYMPLFMKPSCWVYPSSHVGTPVFSGASEAHKKCLAAVKEGRYRTEAECRKASSAH